MALLTARPRPAAGNPADRSSDGRRHWPGRLLVCSMAGLADFGAVCPIVIWRSHLKLFG
ncbi:hypothetical protein [Thioclava sp. NG1]|uniref:hypothetical protein n=1 Tax=Thioclava sp. NG1 TaxID=2182426 RepID=UPI001304A37D|nr:hypothetical protein [Thioclava sp. NG1]